MVNLLKFRGLGFRGLGFGGFHFSFFVLRFSLFIFFASLFTLHSSLSFANNLTISNVSLEDRNQNNDTAIVEFDISWDNAWNITTGSSNHDAVWVFLKVCKGSSCSPTVNTAWLHGMLKTAGTDPTDTDPGSDGNLTIEVSADKMGAFIYPSLEGTQDTVTSTNVQLTLDYGASPTSASDTDDIQVKVLGIEMVYISEGDFYIGDGNGSSESTYAFHAGTGNTAQQITGFLLSDIRVDMNSYDDSRIENSGIGIDGDGGLDRDNDGIIDNYIFPTGYTAFYLMKYELSQAQYRDFLNTLTQEQQNRRTAGVLTDELAANEYVMATDGAMTPTNRDTIKAGSNPSDGLPYTFGCDLDDNNSPNESADGEWIAMNYMSWMDLVAYADWAGLRPMTELEFEKAARGPTAAVYGEYAWGTTDLTQAEGAIQSSGTSSEVANTIGNGLANYNGAGTDVSAPLRVGFAAASSTNRVQSGAGYYGAMNLSDNLYEHVVTVGNSTGRAFEGTHGDGILTTTNAYEGNATNTDWPGINGTSSRGVTGAVGSGFRVGYHGGTWMTTSQRNIAALLDIRRLGSFGGRLARTENLVNYVTVIYISTMAVDTGDIGPRSFANDHCVNYRPSNLPAACVGDHAFIAYEDPEDELLAIPSVYNYRGDLPVYWWHNTNRTYTQFASDWPDMFDGSISASQTTGTGVSGDVYTGANSDGTYGVAKTCNNWTDGSAGSNGQYGSAGATDGGFLNDGVDECNNSHNIRCACQLDEDEL